MNGYIGFTLMYISLGLGITCLLLSMWIWQRMSIYGSPEKVTRVILVFLTIIWFGVMILHYYLGADTGFGFPIWGLFPVLGSIYFLFPKRRSKKLKSTDQDEKDTMK